MKKTKKSVMVSPEIWKILTALKTENERKTIEDVVRDLLKRKEKRR